MRCHHNGPETIGVGVKCRITGPGYDWRLGGSHFPREGGKIDCARYPERKPTFDCVSRDHCKLMKDSEAASSIEQLVTSAQTSHRITKQGCLRKDHELYNEERWT